MSHDIMDELVELLERRGGEAYFGEPVTQRAHALQCAWLASCQRAGDPLIVAALLHDIGHMLHDLGESAADAGLDAVHEEVGQRWLRQFFGPDVTEPVRLHVAAKRYLCAVDREYAESLSAASRQSLALQGGPFTADELAAFTAQPFARDAIELRRWDDLAKTADLEVPDLRHYGDVIRAVAARRSAENP